jgi:hypothetical protein
MSNWKKIEKVEDLPPFDKLVLVRDSEDENLYPHIGELEKYEISRYGLYVEFDVHSITDKLRGKALEWCEIPE